MSLIRKEKASIPQEMQDLATVSWQKPSRWIMKMVRGWNIRLNKKHSLTWG